MPKDPVHHRVALPVDVQFEPTTENPDDGQDRWIALTADPHYPAMRVGVFTRDELADAGVEVHRLRRTSESLTDFQARRIFETVGAASACWENLEGAGEFDSPQAGRFAAALAADLGIALPTGYQVDRPDVDQGEPPAGSVRPIDDPENGLAFNGDGAWFTPITVDPAAPPPFRRIFHDYTADPATGDETPEGEPDDAPPAEFDVGAALEAAWGVIANAGGRLGGWNALQDPEWTSAAQRWRDDVWHPWLELTVQPDTIAAGTEPQHQPPDGADMVARLRSEQALGIMVNAIGWVALEGDDASSEPLNATDEQVAMLERAARRARSHLETYLTDSDGRWGTPVPLWNGNRGDGVDDVAELVDRYGALGVALCLLAHPDVVDPEAFVAALPDAWRRHRTVQATDVSVDDSTPPTDTPADQAAADREVSSLLVQALVRRRQLRDIAIDDMAAQLGVSRAAILELEDTGDGPVSLVQRYARALGVSVDLEVVSDSPSWTDRNGRTLTVGSSARTDDGHVVTIIGGVDNAPAVAATTIRVDNGATLLAMPHLDLESL